MTAKLKKMKDLKVNPLSRERCPKCEAVDFAFEEWKIDKAGRPLIKQSCRSCRAYWRFREVTKAERELNRLAHYDYQ